MDQAPLRQDTIAASPYASLGEGLEAAEMARNRGDNLAALQIFAELREQFPEHPAPHLRPVAILSQLRRFDEAERLLAEGAARFPNEPGFAIERAWLAHRRGDRAEAIGRWEGVRSAMPEHHVGYTGGALTLRDAGRFAEAEALLEEAMKRFPDDLAPRADYAWVAQIARDWPEALRRWEEVRRRHPEEPVGFTAGAITLRELSRFDEADALLADAIARFPERPAPLVEYAWLASAQRDWLEAARRWALVRERFPDAGETYLRGAQAYSALWRYDEAEALLAEALNRFPQDSGIACEYAWLAYQRHELDEAARRFETVRRWFRCRDRLYRRCPGHARPVSSRRSRGDARRGASAVPGRSYPALRARAHPAVPSAAAGTRPRGGIAPHRAAACALPVF